MELATTAEPAMALSAGQLEGYLEKIGVEGPVPVDLKGLTRLHRAHLTGITWDAIDAFMGWPNSIVPADAYAKMVEGRRGGWCYEMNGLFGAALAALGFRVTRLCGCVDRPKLGDLGIGNHLTLRVDLERPYLAEVGVADAFIDPVPMEVGAFSQRGFAFSIASADDGWLRLHNHARGVARTVDFKPDHSDEAKLAAMQAWLMRDEGSPFTNALAVFRHTEDGYVVLQNDLLRRIDAEEVREERIESADHLAAVFETVFDIAVPDVRAVWDKVESLDLKEVA